MKSEQDKFQGILRERAQRLTQPLQQKTEETVKLIVFSLGEELYGFEAEYVREVVKAGKITFVPYAPDFIEGVINLRGSIISVVDLAKILNIQDVTRIGERWVIVVGVGLIEAALHIDLARGVIDVPKSSIEPPLVTLEKGQTEHLKGEAHIDGDLIGILNLENILVAEEMG